MDRITKNMIKFDMICDKIFKLIDDESRPIEEIEAEVNRLRAKADKLDLGYG
jgi:hypothetical protein